VGNLAPETRVSPASVGRLTPCYADLGYTICEVCVSGGGAGSASQGRHPIRGALDPSRAAVENVRVDHGGVHVAVAE